MYLVAAILKNGRHFEFWNFFRWLTGFIKRAISKECVRQLWCLFPEMKDSYDILLLSAPLPAVADHSPGPFKLSVSAREVVGRSVRRQPIFSGVCFQAGKNSLVSPESGGSTPALVGRESIDSSSSVCRGHSQRGCLLSLATQRSVRFQVDPSAGSGGSTGPSLASELRSICHGSQSSDASLLCSDGGPSFVWHRRASSMLESSSGVHLSSFSAGSSGLQRVLGVDELRGHSSGPMVAGLNRNISPISSNWLGSLRWPCLFIATFSDGPTLSLPSQSAFAASTRMETVGCFARMWGMSNAVARQLSVYRQSSAQRLYQQRCLACQS